MSYTPINWQTGDTITAEKMNKMDNGWGVQNAQLFSETVTTVDGGGGFATGYIAYGFTSRPDTAVITYDDTVYTLTINAMGGYGGIGSSGPDFTNYPFYVSPEVEETTIYTATAGTHTISFTAGALQISSDFNNAVNKCVDTSRMPLLCISGVTTYDDMIGSYEQGIMMYFHADSKCFYITQVAYNEVHFIPESSYVTATFVDDVFTVTVS